MCFQRDKQIIQNVYDDVLCFEREREKQVVQSVLEGVLFSERETDSSYEIYMRVFCAFRERWTSHMKCTRGCFELSERDKQVI